MNEQLLKPIPEASYLVAANAWRYRAMVTSYLNQWDGLHAWFLGQGGRDSDLIYSQDTTNETVRRMTRFAQRLGEKHHNFKSQLSMKMSPFNICRGLLPKRRHNYFAANILLLGMSLFLWYALHWVGCSCFSTDDLWRVCGVPRNSPFL